MKIRNFEEDLANSNNEILRKNWIKIFKKKFGDDIDISWKDNIDVQKSFGTDITIKTSKGRRFSVELKTRNYIQEHSKKPDCVRDKIVQLVGDLPRIELFARKKTEG